MISHSEPTEVDYIGFHSFMRAGGGAYGSFEVFWSDSTPVDGEPHEVEPGYYWWACFPGCLPDSDAVGPFDTASEAFNNAQDTD